MLAEIPSPLLKSSPRLPTSAPAGRTNLRYATPLGAQGADLGKYWQQSARGAFAFNSKAAKLSALEIPVYGDQRTLGAPFTNITRFQPRIMTVIESGAKAPSFELDSHLGDKVSSSDFAGKKNMLIVFYPLDFTPT